MELFKSILHWSLLKLHMLLVLSANVIVLSDVLINFISCWRVETKSSLANLLFLKLRTSIHQSKESLLKKSLDFAEKYIKVSSEDIIGVVHFMEGVFFYTHVFTIIYVDTIHCSKGKFPVTCVITSFKIRSRYIVANLLVEVHLAEDFSVSSMKLWVLSQIVLFIALL